MKKRILTIAGVFIIASVLFFACKKEKVETCGADLVAKATAFEKKAAEFEKKADSATGVTTVECAALKTEALGLIAEVKACSQTSSNKILIAELDDLAAEINCNKLEAVK
ncbi:MAG: hypothetical protein EAY66_08200 [Sphingobacteriales bacterium]|nr:MAG: hypothetical protein EAY66_08200 [Sphingobacteriales bacterium]